MKFILLTILLMIGCGLLAKKERTVTGCKPVYKDRIFMKETEVTNFEYLEYLYYQKKHLGNNSVESLLPDTNVWKRANEYNEPYVEYYFRHPAYRNYPLVGLTKKQANEFCLWLTVILTENYRKNHESDIDSVFVRLPTKQEWIDAAKGGNDYYEYPWKGHDVRMTEGKWQGDMRANFVRGKGDYMGIAGSLNDNADVTAPVRSYWPNDYGLYNCAGNVAEMVSDDDVAMGGSWRSSGFDIKVTSEIRAAEPSSEIGFRYIVEVVKLKPVEIKELKIDKKFVKQQLVGYDSLLVAKYEATNQLYNLYLKETGKEIQDTLVWKDQFIYSNWYQCNYRWHSIYTNYPAVGMTRDEVELFCEWLTKKLQPFYGETIQVDLPTEAEWEKVSRGGLELSPYPWGGPYIRNSKGAILGNHKYVPESFKSRSPKGDWVDVYPKGRHSMFGADLDGALATAPVDSYHPNSIGLYNTGGNVRELVRDERDITKGGGWNSMEYYMQISSRENIENLPAADIGFRFVVRRK